VLFFRCRLTKNLGVYAIMNSVGEALIRVTDVFFEDRI
jgi:hypothetical protein